MRKRLKLPDFSMERKLWRQGYTVIGVDEVGRGALAGPVYVGAFSFRIPDSPGVLKEIESIGIRDSKRAGLKMRKTLHVRLQALGLSYAVASSSIGMIDRFGIVEAVRSAVRKSIVQVLRRLNGAKVFALLDAFPVKHIIGIGLQNQLAVRGGDESSLSIAAASIMAKVARDNYMCQISPRFKSYRWDENKGYGTKAHRRALKKFGPTRFHRSLFIDGILGLSSSSYDQKSSHPKDVEEEQC